MSSNGWFNKHNIQERIYRFVSKVGSLNTICYTISIDLRILQTQKQINGCDASLYGTVNDIMKFECFVNSTDSTHRVSGDVQKNDNIRKENDRDTNTNVDPQDMEDVIMEGDLWLVDKIKCFGTPYCFVRSKLDDDLKQGRSKEEIRQKLEKSMQKTDKVKGFTNVATVGTVIMSQADVLVPGVGSIAAGGAALEYARRYLNKTLIEMKKDAHTVYEHYSIK
ncbi:unnamed protein product [Mytilus edulis]|uniref:Uncharacterized protein n=1 Tax=Mytilus edulis TaxID=6550 RepID=A0A8S3R182_MYTED|nr:unnamed protein product [Mytilus edulis]